MYLCGDQVVERVGVSKVSPKDHPLAAPTLRRLTNPEQSVAGGIGSLDTKGQTVSFTDSHSFIMIYRDREPARDTDRYLESRGWSNNSLFVHDVSFLFIF